MATFTKQLLSGSTNGRPILVAATGSPGTAIHTSVAGTTNFDEIWLYAACATTGSNSILTIQYGGTTSPDDNIKLALTGTQGLSLVLPGAVLNNSAVVRAHATTGSIVNITGWVHRIAQ